MKRLRQHAVVLVAVSVVVSTLTVLPPEDSASAVTVSASQLPGLLTSQADQNANTYDRALFQHWIDADGDGCDTRGEVLVEESVTTVTVSSGCSLSGGQWLSPYDQVSWTDPADVDIDHVVPLAEAWRSGAWAWTESQRREFANDLEVAYALAAVTDNVNQSKGDSDPAQWIPSYGPAQCQYLIDWALVKYRWSMTVDWAEMSTLASGLSGACGARDVALPIVKRAGAGGAVGAFPAGVTRLAGASRYETAVEVSKKFEPGVSAAFIATGTNFPDALSGAAAAALLGGPLLLTTPTALPPLVESELRRLNPTTIYVLGSVGVVSRAVEQVLSSIAPVQRFGGANRYETGLNVVNGVFETSSRAFIATGRNFPDALAATGAAGKFGAPVILVDGAQASVPTAVLTSLRRMGVIDITIAGSGGVVSAGIQSQLALSGFVVARYGGTNRYETTALINNAHFPPGSSDTIFLATGTNFPDALAGAALAGRLAAPVFITTTDCTPQPIHDARNALGASKTVVLGSASVVGDRAANNLLCLPGPLFSGAVSAGAFCAQQYSGWYGYTSGGTLMRCVRSPTDDRLRWRAV